MTEPFTQISLSNIPIWVLPKSFLPIPSGMTQFTMDSKLTTFSSVYDPYTVPAENVTFTAFSQPVPYTTELFIRTINGKLMFSTEKGGTFPAIYVFTQTNLDQLGGKFLFHSKDGYCIPDLSGKPLQECMKSYVGKSGGNTEKTPFPIRTVVYITLIIFGLGLFLYFVRNDRGLPYIE